MIIDELIRDRISGYLGFDISIHEIEVVNKIIIDKPINLVWAATLTTPPTFENGDMKSDSNSMKLARVLNIILLRHFEDVDEFLNEFRIDHHFITDLWSSNIRNPKGKMIAKLIREYNIDPIYLFSSKKSMFLQPIENL